MVRKGRRRQRGKGIFGSIGKFLKKGMSFLKKHKILSSLGSALGPISGQYGPAVGAATGLASSLGFGRRRRRIRGSGLRPAGGRRCR